mgnify:FL=1
MNRTYLQQRLKTNIIVQWLYMKYVCYYSKRFLANPEIWKKYQLNKLTTILSYAQQHCTYYKRIIRGKVDTSNSITLLKSLPLLDKNIIRHQEKNVYSDEITDNWKVWLNTGGSTGEPLHFPALYKGLPVEGVCQMMLYMKMGYQWGDIIVSFDGCRIKDEDRSRNIYWQMGNANFPFGKKNFSTLYLDNNSVKYYWEELKRTKPAFIRGYPSGIMEMCKLAMNTGIVMDLKLKGVYLTSESFTQDEKNFISSYFKCPVYGQYGHTESSIFAIQNPADEVYYCSPIYGYTEVVDQKGQHVNIGEQGEVVVTGFVEYGLPFIRYKTGDLAIYGGETELGETILTKLLGREVDCIYNKGGKKIYLVGFIFGGHIRAFNYIQTWQLHQYEVGKVEMYIVKAREYSDNVEKEIVNLFVCNGFELIIHYVDFIEKTNRGRQRFLIQELK